MVPQGTNSTNVATSQIDSNAIIATELKTKRSFAVHLGSEEKVGQRSNLDVQLTLNVNYLIHLDLGVFL